ncbi:uncharacterized protein LTR77_007233 [Saxophila tyrrhenica]|uniref:Aspergillus nuclease S(1) n=1 Tax=Saxophila tyrrhenica TaxID=1690608 RepID=A0AAV9P3Z8_9PEZI|nr:hypothetical protein LTR77_007233 [Saxophila tyrrhenica]
MHPLILLPLAALPSTTYAWGSLGHKTVAFIAQNLIANTTVHWAQDILGNSNTTYLASIATWADSYRYTDEGDFTSPFHYIDAEDNPPESCNVDYERDCGEEGCVVSAIANYTARVQQSELGEQEVDYALRFLVHFLGDITQPLHDEALALGGNDIDVTFDGDETNLHSVWDTSIPEELVGGYDLADAEAWAANLTNSIRNGSFAAQSKSWLKGLDIEDPKASAMVWARDGNSYVCSTVLPDGTDPLEGEDLYPEYYEGAVDVVKLQIAKGGVRLAAWLDALAEKAEVGKRARHWKIGTQGVRLEQDLSGRQLLPEKRGVKSAAKMRREAVGWGCGHQH